MKNLAGMGERLLFLIGAAIVATTLSLLATYNEYKIVAETITVVLGTTGGVLSIIQYLARKKD